MTATSGNHGKVILQGITSSKVVEVEGAEILAYVNKGMNESEVLDILEEAGFERYELFHPLTVNSAGNVSYNDTTVLRFRRKAQPPEQEQI